MSRVYFHSPSGEAKLAGSERAWLAHLASGPGRAAWDLDAPSGIERAVAVAELVPEVPDGEYGANYLHTYLREAVAEEAANDEGYRRAGMAYRGSFGAQHRFVEALKTRLSVQGVELRVDGAVLHSTNLELNTTLASGSDPIRLAAKIHGWCEVHAWVEGADRAWLASVIDQGLTAGLYRRRLNGISQGWEEVQELLRSRDDEPVVMSYSVCEQFPGYHIGDWLPAFRDGQEPRSWEEYEALPQEVRDLREARQESWYDLPDDRQWEISMAGLRERRPWARLAPDTLASETFGPAVTVYDLFAPDRAERIANAVYASPTPKC